jgi:Cu/Zn superoxide dismutase
LAVFAIFPLCLFFRANADKSIYGKVIGSANFLETTTGMQLTVQVSGLTPGLHGMHIHTTGSCTDTVNDKNEVVKFGGAGTHFDPYATESHGGPSHTELESHAGDIGNIAVDTNGYGYIQFVTRKLTVSSDARAVVGRAIILHANQDMYTNDPPLGNSGARVACAVIALTVPTASVDGVIVAGSGLTVTSGNDSVSLSAGGVTVTDGNDSITVERGVSTRAFIINDDGLRTNYDCASGANIVVNGSANVLEFRGNCLGIVVNGNNNMVTLNSVTGVHFNGDYNNVRWLAGSPATLSDLGVGNTVSR